MAVALDIRTLTFASMVIIAVLFGYLVYFQRTRKTYPGFGLWTAASASMSVGLAMLVLRGLIPDLVSILGANFLMMLDVVLILRGMTAFNGLRRRPWPDALLLTVYMSLVYWFAAVQPSLSSRALLLSLGFAWFLGCAAWMAAGPTARLLGTRNWLLLGGLAGTAAYYLLRAVMIALAPAVEGDYLAPDTIMAVTLTLSFAAHIIVNTGLVMLNVQRLEKELTAAQGEVKMLTGLLPICSGCKRIRDERGGWQPVEAYISRHSQAEFSHGICPECLTKHYPEVAGKVLER